MSRPYRRRQELRELLLDHGVELLIEEGVHDDNLTLQRVFERVERAGLAPVSKGSVLGPDRVWGSQREFQRDVEKELVARWAAEPSELTATLEAAASVLSMADTATLEGRRRAVRELCRVAGQANLDYNRHDRRWRVVIALWAREATSDEADRELVEAIDRAVRSAAARTAEHVYRPMADLLGYRGRSEFGSTDAALDLLAVSAARLLEGFLLADTNVNDRITLPTGPDGIDEEWSPFTIAFEAILNRYLEPDPSYCDQ